MTVRVVIADDQGMVRSGFTTLLNSEPDIEVIGEAVNGQEAIARAAQLRPDVLLMDVRCRCWTACRPPGRSPPCRAHPGSWY